MRQCSISGKKTMHGCNVSHSNRHTKRIWKPNLQTVRVVVDGVTKKIKVCARYLKKLNKLNKAS